MATYTELYDVAATNVLLDRITVAVVIQAEAVRAENVATPNHANRLRWAKDVFNDPRAAARSATWAVLAQNASATKAQILAASDATILAAVAAVVDVFATGS